MTFERALYSLTLPDLAEAVWKPPANVRRGIARAAEQESALGGLEPRGSQERKAS